MTINNADGELNNEDIAGEPTGSWLWNHIGRISGLVLGVLAFASIGFIAAIGYRPAFLLIVLVLAGVVMIAGGGRMRAR